MRKSVVFLVVAILTATLSGCILSKTPKTNDVNIPLGENVTFSVNVFPTGGTFTWTLDDEPLSNTGKSYVYTAQCGQHILTVKAKHIFGTDTQTWNILTEGPICDLLNSLVSIPAGTFMMGSLNNEYGWPNHSTPVHEVTLQGFEIGANEVTQAQYEAVMGINPSYFQGTGKENNPVEQINWYEAREFCTKLSDLTGRTFTLPSEAQWEYACRAGTTTLYSFGDDDALLSDYAWWWENSNGTGGSYGTHPVGTKLPNPWGLYDMHGNVWEWCLDSWHENYIGAPTDGSAWEPDIGTYHVGRSGSWGGGGNYWIPWRCWSAIRGNILETGSRFNYVGFRVISIP